MLNEWQVNMVRQIVHNDFILKIPFLNTTLSLVTKESHHIVHVDTTPHIRGIYKNADIHSIERI